MVIHTYTKSSEKLGSPMLIFPAEFQQSGTLLSCFSSDAINTCPFRGLFSAISFTFWCFPLGILLFKMAPAYLKCGPALLSTGRLRCVLRRKIHALDELCSGTSDVGRETDGNETTVQSKHRL